MQNTCFQFNISNKAMDRTATFYSTPSYVYGAGGMPVFSGSRRQRGGSIFGSLKSFVTPILKRLGNKVAKRGAQEAVGLAKDVVGDLFLFRNPQDSVLKHGKKRALDLTKFAADESLDTLENMIGSGKRRRRLRAKRRRRQQPSRPRRRSNLRKRKRNTKRSKSRRKVKRRRVQKSLF